jgi:diaminopimelate epimerase
LACYHNELGYNNVRVVTKGGKLRVEFDRVGDNTFENIWLCGKAVKVFEGDIDN